MEAELTTAERIKAVQNQLRIAIQNHQLLYSRRRSCPSDPDIQNHMNVIQGLIISMGRTQAELMSQFRQEIAQQYDTKSSNECISNIISKHLSWGDEPRSIPVYKNQLNKKHNEKKIAYWGSRTTKRESLLRSNKMQSLLKVNNEKEKNTILKKENEESIPLDRSKIKIVYNKSNEEKSILKSKRLQSVLKPKNEKLKNILKSEPIKFQNTRNEEKYHRTFPSEPNSPSSSNSDVKYKESPSLSDSHSDEAEFAEIIPVKRNKLIEPKIEKKFETRLRRKQKLLASEKKKYGNLSIKVNGLVNGRFIAETENIKSISDISQETFLRLLGLVSKSQYDVLKQKRYERKRRSVAGQSSFYSDYFQPSTPKRSYGPRKAQSIPTSPINQVIVETAAEIDDEDDKPHKNRLCCMICNESGSLETCPSCSEVYHSACTLGPSSGCPNCNAQTSNIKSIVGANSASSASSSELIKRYLDI